MITRERLLLAVLAHAVAVLVLFEQPAQLHRQRRRRARLVGAARRADPEVHVPAPLGASSALCASAASPPSSAVGDGGEHEVRVARAQRQPRARVRLRRQPRHCEVVDAPQVERPRLERLARLLERVGLAARGAEEVLRMLLVRVSGQGQGQGQGQD